MCSYQLYKFYQFNPKLLQQQVTPTIPDSIHCFTNQDMLQQIIASMINAASFDHQTFAQIIKIFNIPIDNIYEPNLISILQQKLKAKLNDIFLSQGKNYQDYLRLPKFSILKPQTKIKLTILLNQIWQRYQTQKIRQNKNGYSQILQFMVPQFRSLNQIEVFHLQMFTQFKTSKLCKQNANLQKKQQQQQQEQQNNMMQSTQNNYNMAPIDPLLTGFHRPGMGSSFYPKMQGEFFNGDNRMFGNNNGMGNLWQRSQTHPSNIMQPIHNPHNNTFPIPHAGQSMHPNPHINRSFYPNPSPFPMQSLNSNMQAQQKGVYGYQKPIKSSISSPYDNLNNNVQSSLQEQEQNSQEDAKLAHITGQDDQLQKKLNHYQFIECACQSNFKSQQYFQCKSCQFNFHYQCLNISEEHTVDICPCCKLKQGSNIFVKIHPQPFGRRWCKMHIRQKLSMFLTEREIQKMRDIKLNIKPNSLLEYQLRFLKIPNKQVNANTLKNSNANRKVSSLANSDTRKFNNLPLPSGYIEKIQPYNVFEISLRPGEMNNNNRQEDECLYLFGIFMIEKYSQTEITQSLFGNINAQNSVGEQYLQRLLVDCQQGLQIKLIDPTSQKPIRYPIRGQQCSHAQVFDCLSILQYYKQYGQKLTQMHCPICENEFTRMIVDNFLYEKLRECDGQEYQKLKYFGNGKVQFIAESQQPSQKSIDYNNDNQQLPNGMKMEEQQKQSNPDHNNQQLNRQSQPQSDNNNGKDQSASSLSC